MRLVKRRRRELISALRCSYEISARTVVDLLFFFCIHACVVCTSMGPVLWCLLAGLAYGLVSGLHKGKKKKGRERRGAKKKKKKKNEEWKKGLLDTLMRGFSCLFLRCDMGCR